MSARELAARSLVRMYRDGLFIHDQIAAERSAGGVDAREAALAQEIALRAVRHGETISFVLSRVARYDPKHVTPVLRSILETAAAQVIWMPRVPVFAAVDEAVSLARMIEGPRSAGMVNAVLRSLARSIRARETAWRRLDTALVRIDWTTAVEFDRAVLPELVEGPASGDAAGLSAEQMLIAIATSTAPGRYRELFDRFGERTAESVAWASQAQPVRVLWRNPLRCVSEAYASQVRAEFGAGAELLADAAFLPAMSPALGESRLLRDGRAYLQDSTARACAGLVQAAAGERILDLCAAPGGKSIAMALQMGDRGEIAACDVAEGRLRRLDENVRRLGLTCVRPTLLNEGIVAARQLTGPFDAALVDAPCSNTGVLARRPEARLRATPQSIAGLARLQLNLLRQAAALVRAGGRLVYSTCSIEPEENERVVEAFLSGTSGWVRDEEIMHLPAWGEELSAWRDGGFAARLRKS